MSRFINNSVPVTPTTEANYLQKRYGLSLVKLKFLEKELGKQL